MAALLIVDIQPGDDDHAELYVCLHRWRFVLRGAKGVFVDIRPDTMAC